MNTPPQPTVPGLSSHQDTLSEVLETFPPEVRFAGRLELGAPWSLRLPEGAALVCSVLEGRCLATADTAWRATTAAPGDLLLLSPGAEHRLSDTITTQTAAVDWLGLPRSGDPLTLKFGGPGARTALVGGVFQLDDPRVHPFCWGLPPVVHLTPDAVDRAAHLRALLHAMVDELSARRPGRGHMVRRLVEILFIEAARSCLAAGDDPAGTTFGELLHPDLGPALVLMHRHPEKPWTVAELAERVAMSRSAFAGAFVKALGRPPVEYLRRRRMELAGRLLKNPSLGLKEVALRVGYDSVSAFNSAFKQWWGISPGRFRGQDHSTGFTG
ncbi:MAG TPA: AraC family transcriptional regulator [Thermoguttaceae bacterium]|nr:AraC family transcriptional regulator [Thermoguttaceae bacterium]